MESILNRKDKLVLQPVPFIEAERALRTSLLYHWPRYIDIRVTHEQIPLKIITTVIPIASTRRVRNAEDLLRKYVNEAIEPYAPARIVAPFESTKVLFSPLVELNMGELVLLDGMHRCLATLRADLETVTVALVRPEQAPPAAGPSLPLNDIAYSLPSEEPPPFFEGRGCDNYRPGALFIETARSIDALRRKVRR